jgi:outer membrane protein assembly factor BamB
MGHGRNQKDKRYYSGVDHRRTTRCCSAVALTLSLSASVWAQPPTPRPYPAPKRPTVKADSKPFPLTPAETVWGLALNSSMTAAPAYDGRRAYFSLEGDRVVAYDLMSGTREWMTTAHPLMQPAAGDGLLFLLEAATLKALRADDGSVAWELPIADTLAARPVWDNGWLILATEGGEIRAFRATDGHLIWTRDLKSPAHAAPALAADRVYVPTRDGRIVALRVESGELVWERRLGGAADEILALNDRLFTGSQDNFFYCVMAADGRVDWRWRTGGDVIGLPVADDRYVYFVALDNVLRAMNMVSGGQQWIRALPVRPAWGPVKAGATILVSGPQAPIRAYNVKDGKPTGTLTGVATLPPPDPPADAAAKPAPPAAPPALQPLPPDVYLAAMPHVLEHPLTHLPVALLLFKDIAKGASATLVTHSVEPLLVDKLAALPNLIQIAPVTPTTPPPRD